MSQHPYNSIAGVELTGGDATDKRDVLTGFTVSWFEYFYAEAGAQVFEDAMANQAAAARPSWMWARHSAHSSSSTSTPNYRKLAVCTHQDARQLTPGGAQP